MEDFMEKIMQKAVEIVSNFDGIEEISIWKSKDGIFYLMVYLTEPKAKLYRYDTDKKEFEFRQEKNFEA